jgi:hypothetical protein
MHALIPRWGWLAALALSMALGACGGSGGGTEEPESVRTTADSATAQRGQALVVDVLANDSTSRNGALTLARISEAPAGGQAVIEANRIRYTPNPDHLGVDRLRYVARAASGAEATGELTISTEARVVLRGTVIDSPIANATVTLTAGGRSYTATADAQGQYELEAVLQQLGEMLRLEALGVGAQSQVRLSSLVGDAASVLAATGTSGSELDEAAFSTLRVTHVSTAQEVLVREAAGGELPATQAALETARAGLDPVQLINLAATVRLVVDGGLALPAGVPDTLALVSTPAVRETFQAANAAALGVMAAQVAGDPAVGLAAFSPLAPGADSATKIYFFGRGGVGQTAYRVVYRADGTADVTGASSQEGTRGARWSLDDGELTLRFDPPWTSQTISFPFNPATGRQEQATDESRLHALHIRVVSGNRDAALVQLAQTSSFLRNGAVLRPIERGAPFVYQQRALSALDTPLRAEDFAPGSRWAGLGFVPAGVPAGSFFLFAGMHDLMAFEAEGVARQIITGERSSWQVNDGVLELRQASGARLLYRRLQRVGGAEERWLVEFVPADGGPVRLTERLVVRQDPALVFDTASVTGLWLSQINLLTFEGNTRFFVRLQADGVVAQVLSNYNSANTTWQITETPAGNWTLLPDGSMRALRVTANPGSAPTQNLRDWIPLAREGNKLMVLEWRTFLVSNTIDRAVPTSIDGWRTNIYTLAPNAY